MPQALHKLTTYVFVSSFWTHQRNYTISDESDKQIYGGHQPTKSACRFRSHHPCGTASPSHPCCRMGGPRALGVLLDVATGDRASARGGGVAGEGEHVVDDHGRAGLVEVDRDDGAVADLDRVAVDEVLGFEREGELGVEGHLAGAGEVDVERVGDDVVDDRAGVVAGGHGATQDAVDDHLAARDGERVGHGRGVHSCRSPHFCGVLLSGWILECDYSLLCLSPLSEESACIKCKLVSRLVVTYICLSIKQTSVVALGS